MAEAKKVKVKLVRNVWIGGELLQPTEKKPITIEVDRELAAELINGGKGVVAKDEPERATREPAEKRG